MNTLDTRYVLSPSCKTIEPTVKSRGQQPSSTSMNGFSLNPGTPSPVFVTFLQVCPAVTLGHRAQPKTEPDDSSNCASIANPRHLTASVFINDDESGLHQDYDRWLEKIAPH